MIRFAIIIMSKIPCEKFKQINNLVRAGKEEFPFSLAFDEINVLATQSLIEYIILFDEKFTLYWKY